MSRRRPGVSLPNGLTIANMAKRQDIAGLRFGKLKAMYYLGSARDNSGAIWRCECDCGGFIKVRRKSLMNGSTKSCGCLREEYQRWRGGDGFADVVNEVADDGIGQYGKQYETALKFARILATKFGTVMLCRAVRQLRQEERNAGDDESRSVGVDRQPQKRTRKSGGNAALDVAASGDKPDTRRRVDGRAG